MTDHPYRPDGWSAPYRVGVVVPHADVHIDRYGKLMRDVGIG